MTCTAVPAGEAGSCSGNQLCDATGGCVGGKMANGGACTSGNSCASGTCDGFNICHGNQAPGQYCVTLYDCEPHNPLYACNAMHQCM